MHVTSTGGGNAALAGGWGIAGRAGWFGKVGAPGLVDGNCGLGLFGLGLLGLAGYGEGLMGTGTGCCAAGIHAQSPVNVTGSKLGAYP